MTGWQNVDIQKHHAPLARTWPKRTGGKAKGIPGHGIALAALLGSVAWLAAVWMILA
jgi:hypothetical protein